MKRPMWIAVLTTAMLLFVAALYATALTNPFMIDDHFAIENHPDVIEPQGLWQLWHHDYWTGQTADKNLYRPITVLSFHLGARGTGPQPAAFRAVNVLLLAALATLAAIWMQRYVHPAAA